MGVKCPRRHDRVHGSAMATLFQLPACPRACLNCRRAPAIEHDATHIQRPRGDLGARFSVVRITVAVPWLHFRPVRGCLRTAESRTDHVGRLLVHGEHDGAHAILRRLRRRPSLRRWLVLDLFQPE
jgi:hypothetical protein